MYLELKIKPWYLLKTLMQGVQMETKNLTAQVTLLSKWQGTSCANKSDLFTYRELKCILEQDLC